MDDRSEEEVGEAVEEVPFTEEEQVDLVALLNEGRTEETFWLPTRNEAGEIVDSTIYFVRARRWTGAQKAQYLSVGTEYHLPVSAGTNARPRQVRWSDDRARQLQVLCETSVTDYLVPIAGGQVQSKASRPVWTDLGGQPAPFLDWLVKCLRRLQGLEVTAAGEA